MDPLKKMGSSAIEKPFFKTRELHSVISQVGIIKNDSLRQTKYLPEPILFRVQFSASDAGILLLNNHT
jgi:hypothetical protein